MQLGERQQFLKLDEAFEDETLILDNVIKWNVNNRVEATYIASYTKRDLLVSRDHSAEHRQCRCISFWQQFGFIFG